jgi:hydroxypyruvate reductase
MVISDVVGDRLDVIASGPLIPDPTTPQDAIDVLRQRGLWREVPAAVRQHLLAGSGGEGQGRPGADDPCWAQVEVQVVGNSLLAAEAAIGEAMRRGFEARLLTTSLEGEARNAGSRLALLERDVRNLHQPVAPPACLVAGGETTVTVRGAGKGGRNQELALAAAVQLAGRKNVLLAAFGSDGIDGPTDAAGAWVDGDTVERGRALGIEASAALEANDAYSYFSALDDLIITGPTGTNVMDLALLFVR